MKSTCSVLESIHSDERQRSRLARSVAASVIAASLLFGTAGSGQAQEVTLSMVGAFAFGTSAAAEMAARFMEEVNKNGEGKVQIEYRGAGEVIPVFDQPEANVRGVFDIWFGAPNYWAGIVPGGYVTELALTEIPDQGPDSELYAFLTEIFEPHGVRYLGHFSGNNRTGSHYMATGSEIASLDDLAGATIRVPPLTRFFVEAIGAEPVTLPPGEIYIALERGTVDGMTWPYFDGFTDYGWHEVAKFVIDAPLYRNGVSMTMNLDKWNGLSAEVQEILIDAVRTTQHWGLGWVAAHQVTQRTTMQAAGMQFVALSPEDQEKWATVASDTLWDHFRSSMPEDQFNRARALLGYE